MTERKSKGLITASWYAGSAAKNDNKQRVVPDNWQKYSEEWLKGYDNIPMGKVKARTPPTRAEQMYERGGKQ